jgi:pimeloyl-ACP methyl ester carboxylesterase
MPLLITHGWPGSVVEFHKVIAPLTDPTAYGGDAADAFHVVCPSLPGFGFSAKPKTAGWGVDRIAAAWATLMGRLDPGEVLGVDGLRRTPGEHTQPG